MSSFLPTVAPEYVMMNAQGVHRWGRHTNEVVDVDTIFEVVDDAVVDGREAYHLRVFGSLRFGLWMYAKNCIAVRRNQQGVWEEVT